MPDLDNLRRGRTWRELVAVTLRTLGIVDAEPRIVSSRISGAAREAEPIRSDVAGLPGGWFLATHAALAPRTSNLLDAAQMSARLSGHEHAAVCIYRRERTAAEAMVTMSLADFASILRRDAIEWDHLDDFEKWTSEQIARDE